MISVVIPSFNEEERIERCLLSLQKQEFARTLYKTLQKENGIDISWERYRYTADVSHYHTFGPIALLNRRLSNGKKILTAHSTPRVNIGNLALTGFINNRYPDIYRKFDHIITISEACEQEVQEMVPDVPVTRIPNGINRDYFSPSKEKRDTFRGGRYLPKSRLFLP